MKRVFFLLQMKLLVLLAMLAGAHTSAYSLAKPPFNGLFRQVAPSVVMIEAIDRQGRMVRGAGFVFNADGQIATAFHVVDGASDIVLNFHDGSRAKAAVSAHDAPFDLAILNSSVKITAPPLELAAQARETGAPVLAIGYPFGHAFSASAGIISGNDRTYEQTTPHGFLQHDAALNPGSSGGPLLNMAGKVVGVNTAIPNGRRSDVGVGFAIPAAVAGRILAALSRDGHIAHGHAGVRFRLIDHALGAALGRPAGGVVIEETEADGPAAKAGLRPGDVILTINNEPIGDLRRLAEHIIGGQPSVRIVLAGQRNGQPLRTEIQLGRMQDRQALPSNEGGNLRARVTAFRAGLEFAPSGAAIVRGIVQGSAAAAAGIQKGDLVLAVGDRSVADAAQARAALALVNGSATGLLVKREGLGSRYVILTPAGPGFGISPLSGNREVEGSAAL